VVWSGLDWSGLVWFGLVCSGLVLHRVTLTSLDTKGEPSRNGLDQAHLS
jgi:hypothetical protein